MDLKQHMEHIFYKEAHQIWQSVQQEQIRKGAEKYPLPFNPDNWTEKDLLQHAMQENVDQVHYMYGLYLKIKQRNEVIKQTIRSLQTRDESLCLHRDLIKDLEEIISSEES
ncbi:hypothetical protein [Shouchella lehensis]|uniref:Uncharacterized protein n=1 Tax=Shouchella lehensis TaxID=300825 RepID=A0A4Y7WE08_9BACI|nr:hypothetical protein [Shouchella lehensis]MBG9783568.1 hypothetical protein [Shouchella lehensis]TES45678.1 hypothetical protein E2L03_20050 [Shouchella lehensis]